MISQAHMDVLNRHEKIALMFSGGKDSLSTIYLLKEFLHKITVVWVNTGDCFPEVETIIRETQKICPNFLEVKTDVKGFIKNHGVPSDIVPMHNTELGQSISGENVFKIISGYECCARNIWFPAMEAVASLGATLVIRGQRKEEDLKSPICSGHQQDGIEYLFPIEDWKTEDVHRFLKENGLDLPVFYHFSESSLDCLSCTAFCEAFSDRDQYFKETYPEKHAENKQILSSIIVSVKDGLKLLEKEASR